MSERTHKPRGLYFPHDANAHSDSNIIPMIHVYGFEGYGWFWRVLEQMRTTDEYKINIAGKYGLNPIAAMLRTTPEKTKEWIHDCVHEFKLFEFDCDGCLVSSSFISRMQHIEHRIEMASNAGRASAAKRAQREIKPGSTDVDKTTNVGSTANEKPVEPIYNTKVKNNIIKDKKENIPISENEIVVESKARSNKKFKCDDYEMRNSVFGASLEFQSAWNAYVEMRRKKNWDLTERTVKSLLKELIALAGNNVDNAIRVVDHAEAGKYRMFYKTPNTNADTKKSNGFVNDSYERVAREITKQ